MKLLGALTSPYVRKVRIVMAEKKLDYQLALEDVWASDAILKANPLGKVPTLVLEGGEAVFDSRVIVEYLDTRSPVSRLIPEASRERTEVRTWERWRHVDACSLVRRTDLGGHGGLSAVQHVQRQMSRVTRRSRDGPRIGRRHSLRATGPGRRRGRLRAGYLDFRFTSVAQTTRQSGPPPGAQRQVSSTLFT
jgi:glutathione S-transferase